MCIFGSRTFVSISWMCNNQTSVSQSSSESEIISLDAGLRMDDHRSKPTLAKPTLAIVIRPTLAKTDFWPNRLWPNRVRLVVVCVCVCAVWWVCVFVCGVLCVRCPRNRPSRDRLPLDRPKCRSFFSLSRRTIRSFLSSLGVFSLNFGGVFEGRDPQMCTFGLSGCCVKPQRLRGRRGFTRQPENSKRAHLSVPALQTPPKFNEKTPREGRKERMLRREREKKARNFGPPTLRAPTLRAPPFGPHPSGPHPSGKQPSGPPHFWPPLFLGWGPHPSNPHFLGPWGPHPLHPPTTTQHTQKNFKQFISKNPNN